MSSNNLKLPINLDELISILRSYGVVKASIFGSFATGNADTKSDLDLLVELEQGRNYLDLGGLQFELSNKIPGGVDIATKLNRHFEPYIRDTLVRIL